MEGLRQRWHTLSTAPKTTVVLMLAASLLLTMSRVLPVSLAVSGMLWVVSLGLVVGAAVFSLRRGQSEP
ncbi:hypothetical protein [Sulfobacillus harzensis]|uniref:Uncharacterized protein n=1 Tax=Sulfobacillus harzensis TaxID=2729629 RepID=A0A7Y0L810_9FIRM|nr:hypothetical protein [Sulfobacillus harzensis]NMP24682.1 hypothetical protein [Sulfobacillus harzensis]